MDCPLWLTTEEIFSQYDFPRKLPWVWQRTGIYSDVLRKIHVDFSAIHANWTSQLYTQTGLLSYTRKLDSEEYSGRVEYIRTVRTVPVVHGTVQLDTHVIEVLIRTYVRTCVTYGTCIRYVMEMCAPYTRTVR